MRRSIVSILFVLIHTVWGTPVLHASSSVLANTFYQCPDGYSQPGNSNWYKCYKVVDRDVGTKYQAAQQCTLASVPNAFVNSYIYTLASNASAGDLWLGVSCFQTGNVPNCQNDDGTQFTYQNFFSGQINAAHECVYISAIGKDKQYWSTYDCTKYLSYVCETSAVLVGCPKGYDYFNGNCYKFVNAHQAVSGNDAISICKQTAGGNLATVATAEVNEFLKTDQPGNSYTAFGLNCPNVKANGDRSSCTWNDGTKYGSFNAFVNSAAPVAAYGGGLCDWGHGQWENCWPADKVMWDSYICEAPLQPI